MLGEARQCKSLCFLCYVLAAPSYRIAVQQSLLTEVGFRITWIPLFHVIYSVPLTTLNNILPSRLSNLAPRPRRYSSVYFLLRPRAFSTGYTGYFTAFNPIFAFAAAMRSMPSLSLMRIR